MREYIKPEMEIYDIKNDDALLQASEKNTGGDDDQLSKGNHGAIFDIEDDDEDDLFYKEYTVKW